METTPTLLPQTQDSREAARLLLARAMLRLGEGDANLLTVDANRLAIVLTGTAEHDAHLGSSGNERTSLVGQDLNVVSYRLIAFLRAYGLVKLPKAEALKGVCLKRQRTLTQLGYHLRGSREQQVTGQNCDAVAPDFVCGRYASAHRGIIHDIVVVKSCKVRELDYHRGVYDLLVHSFAEKRSQQN